MTNTNQTPTIDADDALELRCLVKGDPLDLGDAGTFTMVEELDEIIAQRRWASIRRTIFRRIEDDTHWALDWEHSDTEMHEQWSYIKPKLKHVLAVERTVTVWEVQA